MADTTLPPINEAALDRGGRTAWGAIFAGSLLAVGIMVLLSFLGLGFGFAAIDPMQSDVMGATPTTTPIWVFVSQLIALVVGGYAAGRLAGVLHAPGAMLHGASVWALTTVATLYLAITGAAGVVSTASSALGSAISGVSSAAQAAFPEDVSLPNLAVPDVELSDLPEPVQETLRENGITPANFQEEARQAFRDVVSRQEQQRAVTEAQETATDIIQSPGDIGRDIDQFTDALLGQGGVLSNADRQEALTVLEERFGVTPQEAEQALATFEERAQEIQAQAEAAVEEAQAQAMQTAEQATDALSTAAFLAFAASLLGLLAAVGGALLGRPTKI
ncbi:MAG: hypothetical protein ACU0CO_11650 [Shimia sp.]